MSRIERCGFFYIFKKLFIEKNNMKGFIEKLFIAFIFLFAISCSTSKETSEIVFGASSIQSSYEMTITQNQLDSICDADFLPKYDKWLMAKFTDYETDSVFIKRMYVKEYSENEEIIYILIGNNEPYKITKRIGK